MIKVLVNTGVEPDAMPTTGQGDALENEHVAELRVAPDTDHPIGLRPGEHADFYLRRPGEAVAIVNSSDLWTRSSAKSLTPRVLQWLWNSQGKELNDPELEKLRKMWRPHSLEALRGHYMDSIYLKDQPLFRQECGLPWGDGDSNWHYRAGVHCLEEFLLEGQQHSLGGTVRLQGGFVQAMLHQLQWGFDHNQRSWRYEKGKWTGDFYKPDKVTWSHSWIDTLAIFQYLCGTLPPEVERKVGECDHRPPLDVARQWGIRYSYRWIRGATCANWFGLDGAPHRGDIERYIQGTLELLDPKLHVWVNQSRATDRYVEVWQNWECLEAIMESVLRLGLNIDMTKVSRCMDALIQSFTMKEGGAFKVAYKVPVSEAGKDMAPFVGTPTHTAFAIGVLAGHAAMYPGYRNYHRAAWNEVATFLKEGDDTLTQARLGGAATKRLAQAWHGMRKDWEPAE